MLFSAYVHTLLVFCSTAYSTPATRSHIHSSSFFHHLSSLFPFTTCLPFAFSCTARNCHQHITSALSIIMTASSNQTTVINHKFFNNLILNLSVIIPPKEVHIHRIIQVLSVLVGTRQTFIHFNLPPQDFSMSKDAIDRYIIFLSFKNGSRCIEQKYVRLKSNTTSRLSKPISGSLNSQQNLLYEQTTCWVAGGYGSHTTALTCCHRKLGCS